MKNRNTMVWIMIAWMVMAGCSRIEDPNEQNRQLQLLKGTWQLVSVQKDGFAQTGYDEFELFFSGTKGQSIFAYLATGRPYPSPWPYNSGTLQFGTNISSQLIIDSGTAEVREVEYEVTKNELTLIFTYVICEARNVRLSSVSGHWTFIFSKE
jgi:hypothetical protein